jgi:membrane-associated protease RseP (regulator of RpoE activity)
MAYLLGVLTMVVGVPLSIALHELGHLAPAKRFGVKCTQYMIGFGRTIWSRQIGETEYGFKLVPLGGYVRMIGMYPPWSAKGKVRDGRWADVIEQARAEARAEVGPGDEGREFYQKPVWQRVIVMLGGPSMNLMLAVLLFGGVLVGYGLPGQTTTVDTVSACVLSVTAPADATCTASDRPAPAAQAGVRPGDKILSFAGTPVADWDQMRNLIRSNAGRTVPLVVDRGGVQMTLTLTPIRDLRWAFDASGQRIKGPDGNYLTEQTGFAGITPTEELVRQPVTAVPGMIWDQLGSAATLIVTVPEKMVGVGKAILGIAPRDPESPVSVIGIGRVAGEVASGEGVSAGSSVGARVASLVMLLAGLNLALFVINMVPLLPLDGGHVAGALWEALRRAVARVLRRPDPGPVDTVRALPLIYAVGTMLIAMGVLLMVADIVSPVKLTG